VLSAEQTVSQREEDSTTHNSVPSTQHSSSHPPHGGVIVLVWDDEDGGLMVGIVGDFQSVFQDDEAHLQFLTRFQLEILDGNG
jgi:hypothetical protein